MPAGGRVHPALSAACAAPWLQAYPALWPAFASKEEGGSGGGPTGTRHAVARTGGDRVDCNLHAARGAVRTVPLPTLRVEGVPGSVGHSASAPRPSGTGAAVSRCMRRYGTELGHGRRARGGARSAVGAGVLRCGVGSDFLQRGPRIARPTQPNNAPSTHSDYAKRLTSQAPALQSP